MARFIAERLHFRDDPPPGLREFSDKVARSDALVIVTPEYNNGYPFSRGAAPP